MLAQVPHHLSVGRGPAYRTRMRYDSNTQININNCPTRCDCIQFIIFL